MLFYTMIKNLSSKILKIQDLGLFLNDDFELTDINFELSEAEIISIIGPSGCGKSTLLKAIVNLIPIDKGDIILNGESYLNMTPEFLRKQIRYVSSPPNIYNDTVEKYFKDILSMRNVPFVKENILKRFVSIGLQEKHLYSNIGDLSSGELKRIFIVLNLINFPQIILLDEPFNFLDNKSAKMLFDILKDLNQKNNVSFIIISHSLYWAKHISDRTIFMENGRIIEINETMAMLKNPNNIRTKAFLEDKLSTSLKT